MKNKNKINKSIVIFLASIILSFGFIIFPRDAKAADPSISVYDMVTSDTTPIVSGTVSDPTATVSVAIIGFVDRTATVAGDGSWSLQITAGEALATGEDYYAIGVASVIEGELVDDTAFAYVDENYPLEFYYEESDDTLMTSLVLFPEEYTYTPDDGDFSITFPAGTEVTKTGGGSFDLGEWYNESVDFSNIRVILELRFGVPNVTLSFSHDIIITFNVGEEYDGESLNIFSRSDGGDDGWEPMEVSCDVIDGSCTFETDHASFFAISQDTSIAETEEGELDDDEDDDSEKADIDSWKAYRYEDLDSKSCQDKLRLEIKGEHFSDDAKVKIGSHEASSVKKKSSKKLVAKFCMDNLLSGQTSRNKTISVTNPDADTEEADKKINLKNVGYDMSAEDFNPQTLEGIKNIQKILIFLGFLDQKYITGFYGPLTTGAVQKFQADNGILQTGYVGPLTKAKLEEKNK